MSTVLVRATGWLWLDSVAGILLGIVLVFSGARLVRRAVGGLMDEALPDVLERIAEVLLAQRRPGWVAPHACKVHRLGQSIHVDLHIVFPRFWALEDAHDAYTIEDALRAEFGERTEVMLHYEPCTPRSCTYCDAEDCPLRENAFRAALDGFHHRPAQRAAASERVTRHLNPGTIMPRKRNAHRPRRAPLT